MMQRAVKVCEAGTLVVTAAFVILLFVNEPSKPPPVPAVGTANAGAAIYSTRCAGCHGADGGGGFGPTLGGGVVAAKYPNAADQVAVVTKGRGSMPTFGDSLTAEQIAAVVSYTRDQLGR
jgi:mono/diheme cytochrome c family protein